MSCCRLGWAPGRPPGRMIYLLPGPASVAETHEDYPARRSRGSNATRVSAWTGVADALDGEVLGHGPQCLLGTRLPHPRRRVVQRLVAGIEAFIAVGRRCPVVVRVEGRLIRR